MDSPQPQMPTRDAFADAINSTFNVSADGDLPVQFTLVDCKSVLSNERQECYSLLFRAPAGHPPVQETYILENDKLGKINLLLVPVKGDETGIYFEAVMHHLVTR